MPLFKICSHDREIKKLVVADSLTELVQKGVKKLGLSDTVGIQVVLEKDGIDIEEDEELLLLSSSDILMFLNSTSNQKWGLACQPRGSGDFSTQPPDNVTTDNASDPLGDNITSFDTGNDEIYSEIMASPLPKYSSMITSGGMSTETLWRPLVNETANYYFRKFPKIGESCQYKAISQKVLNAYPCIGLAGGARPWSSFSKSVAQKIRHIRHNLKSKSLDNITDNSVKRSKFIPVVADPNITEEDTNEDQLRHQEELVKEWAKQKKDLSHIKLLIQKSGAYYKDLLKKHPGGQIAPIIKEFPCFSDDNMILYKLSLKIGSKKVQKINKNMDILFQAAEKMMGEDYSEMGMRRGIPIIQFMEKETRFDKPSNTKAKGNQNKTETVLSVLKNSEEMEIRNFLKTVDREALQIKVIEIESNIQLINLCGDGCTISCSIENGVWGALKTLMAAYYIFDSNFPRQYSMLLGLLQHVVYEDPYTSTT